MIYVQRVSRSNPPQNSFTRGGSLSLLVKELLRRADLGADTALRQRASNDLFREVRRLKETLFRNGDITVILVSDHIVRLTEEEFLDLSGVKAFENRICDEIQKLLNGVHVSWEKAAVDSGITLVLTGGGSALPMIRNLKDRLWTIGTRRVRCQLAPTLPGDLADRFSREFAQEYPKLTVAMGGSLRALLDERDALSEWHGGAAPPQGLERFPTTGV